MMKKLLVLFIALNMLLVAAAAGLVFLQTWCFFIPRRLGLVASNRVETDRIGPIGVAPRYPREIRRGI